MSNHKPEEQQDTEAFADNQSGAPDIPSHDTAAEDGAAGGDNVADGQLAREVGEWKDKYLRLSAEFDNYRKRTLREKLELAANGGEDVIVSMLPVLDDMDRALDAMAKTDDAGAIRSGIELIAHKLREMLRGRGVAEVEAVGSELDTDLHEAVARTPAADKKHKGKIVDVIQKGYKLKDKVIRHAKVVVGE